MTFRSQQENPYGSRANLTAKVRPPLIVNASATNYS